MSRKEPASNAAVRPAPSPVKSTGRLVGIAVGTFVGLSAATTGLLAGVPAPDLLLRALALGVIFRVAAGFAGAALAKTFIARPSRAAPGAVPETER